MSNDTNGNTDDRLTKTLESMTGDNESVIGQDVEPENVISPNDTPIENIMSGNPVNLLENMQNLLSQLNLQHDGDCEHDNEGNENSESESDDDSDDDEDLLIQCLDDLFRNKRGDNLADILTNLTTTIKDSTKKILKSRKCRKNS